MEINKNFKELLELFNKHQVEYVVVGGYAVAYHGAPRFTGDIDLFVAASMGNAKRVLVALDEFGFGSLGFTVADFSSPGQIIQLGRPPQRIDILTSLTGVEWHNVWQSKAKADLGGVDAWIINKENFVANKKAVGRKKDLADIEAIGEQ